MNVKKNNKKKNILINFDFEELNSAVLRNAQIWKFKKSSNRELYVYVPAEFSHFYFHANKIFIFNHNKYLEYKEVLEYRATGLLKIIFDCRYRLYSLIINIFKINAIRKFIYRKLWVTPRQLKFLIQGAGGGCKRLY